MKKFVIAILFAVMCLSVGVTARAQFPQTEPKIETKDDETNLETQLFLIVGTNREVGDSKLPTSLDPVVKQLRAALPFQNYRLASTLINRVKNEGRLQLNWVGGPLSSTAQTPAGVNPNFNQFNIRQVRLARNSEGAQMIQMLGFNFGARIPIQTSVIAANGAAAPVVNYENTGLGTDISIREGEPAIVGTLNIGPSGDAIILVISARRVAK